MKPMIRLFVGSVALLLVLAGAIPAGAQTYYWTNTLSSGNFTNAGNWSPLGPPVTGGHIATFTNNLVQTVEFTSSHTNSFALFAGAGGVVTQAIGSGNNWHLTGGYRIAQAANTIATVVQTSGHLSVGQTSASTIFELGVGTGSAGTLTVLGGSLTMNGDNTAGRWNVGSNGKGVVAVNGGSVLLTNFNPASDSFAGLRLGMGANGSGRFELHSGTVTNFGALNLGDVTGTTATGMVLQTGGLWVQRNGAVNIGRELGTIGTVTISGGQMLALGELTNARYFTVGNRGVGFLNISDTGSLVVSNIVDFQGFTVGFSDAGGGNVGHGTVNLSGGTLTFLESDILFGGSGRGTFNFSGGSLLVTGSSSRVFVVGAERSGQTPRGTGTINVSGGVATNFNQLIFGNSSSSVAATGVYSQVAGSWVQRNLLNVGSTSANVGSLTIGGGTFTVLNNTVTVGATGQGSLTVTGGLFRMVAPGTGNLALGLNTAGRGSLTLSDNSTVRLELGNQGRLNIGQSGRGTLTVSGGSLFITNSNPSTTHGVNVGFAAGAIGTVLVSGGTVTNFASLIVANFDGSALSSSATTGSYAQTSGQWIQRHHLQIGRPLNSVGTFSLDGGVFHVESLDSAQHVIIGNVGSGTFTMNGGSLVISNMQNDGGFVLGHNVSGRGQMTINNGSVLVNGGGGSAEKMNIGRQGQGTLTINGGSLVFTNFGSTLGTRGIIVGASDAGSGRIEMQGGTVHNYGDLYLASGTGTGTRTGVFAQTAGVWNQRGDVYLGRLAGDRGTLTISGGAFTGISNTVVGASGFGRLVLDGGEYVTRTLTVTNGSANSQVALNSGTLATSGTFVTNATAFVVGNGTGAAILDLRGGTHNFATALIITNAGRVQIQNSTATLNTPSLHNQSGGTLSVANGGLVVNSVFTNAGTYSSLNSVSTFNRAVVNQGAWITDPTTNLFNSHLTITPSGYISASAGDVFIFRSNLVNQSSQSLSWNTLNTPIGTNAVGGGTKFIFEGAGLTQTQLFQHTGLLLTTGFVGAPVPSSNGVQEVNSLAAFDNNFAVGRLELTNTTLFLSQAFPSSTTTNALFVNDLFFFGAAHLIIGENMRLYFVNSNDWTMANVTLLGNAEIHQLVLVPEPSTLLLVLTGAVALWRHRQRKRR